MSSNYTQLQYISPLRFNKFNKHICPMFLKCFIYYLNYVHSDIIIRYFIDENVCDDIMGGVFDGECSLIESEMVKIRLSCVENFKKIESHKTTVKNQLFYSIDKNAMKTCEKCNREQTVENFLLSSFSKMSKFCKGCRYKKKNGPINMAILKKCPMCV